MKKLGLLLLFQNFFYAFSQEFEFAVVQDKEGFVNVRSTDEVLANNSIDQLQNGFVVSHFGADGNWILVEYEKNGEHVDGYIYKDRVVGISTYTEIKSQKSNDNQLVLATNEIKIEISTKLFDKSIHKFEFYKDNPNQLDKIDDKKFFGTDGNIPKIEYNSVKINISNQSFELPGDALENLFEPNFEFTKAYYNYDTKTLYIQAINSDGAGGYALLWIIENGKYKDRIVTIPF